MKINILIFFLFFYSATQSQSYPDINVIPYPKKITRSEGYFNIKSQLRILFDGNNQKRDEEDQFIIDEMIRDLKTDWNVSAVDNISGDGDIIVLKLIPMNAIINRQAYRLKVDKNGVEISSATSQGLFYGTQTLLQLIRRKNNTLNIPFLYIEDAPDIKERAIHYDTKHHQDKLEYVKSFIKDLSRYKINMLVWEWEDKFEYPSHPEIAAPGAFTPQEIGDITAFAKKYYIQLVPLVQGLGHASFILKWPQFAHLREIPASNFEFCPLKDGTYDLLFDLWKDAIDATNGSGYIHIGSDETYELGQCENCRKKAEEIGKKGLYHLFSGKAAEFILSKGRKAMIWESPGWINSPNKVTPNKNLVFTEEDGDKRELSNAKKSKDLGYKVFFYDPNPGIEPLFLPYDFKINEKGRQTGALEDSYRALKKAANSGIYDGIIRTSWDDAGLHNQVWMLLFANAAEYSWNGNAPGVQEFKKSFFKDYYGDQSSNIDELYTLLNEGAYYYWDMLERKVWHWGEIGNTVMPDLPRGDAVEYDPFWNTQYRKQVKASGEDLRKMNRALQVIEENKQKASRHKYDFEVYESIAQLIKHTCLIFENLSNIENNIKEANGLTFIDRDSTYFYLKAAEKEVESCIERRNKVYNDLVNTWEKTRLPKGWSGKEKKYFFQQDRTRHFANRRADMTYLIYDEQLLNMEGYLEQLKEYTERYRKLK